MLYSIFTRLLMPSAWWGRMRVIGLEQVPESGPVLLVPNHDSQWDPIVVALAVRKRRKLRFLARADLWKVPGLGPVLYGLGQIPIQRGAGDAGALAEATEALRAGAAVCIFPEGKLSRGERLRARSGVGRLAAACPQARIVLCAVAGATDYVRFPRRRPRVTVAFFSPNNGQPQAADAQASLAERLLAELRGRVPPVPAGRHPSTPESDSADPPADEAGGSLPR